MAKTDSKRKKGKSNVTIFDVADRAGVSIKTVSRVMNDEPNVSPKTRAKVLAAVEKLGYEPHQAARELSGRRSFVIGLAYENPDEFSYIKDVLDGVLKKCDERGYSLLLRPISTPSADIAAEIRKFAIQARVEGFVLPPPLSDETAVTSLLNDLNIPFATISARDPQPDAIDVHCNEEKATFDVTELLIDRGHRRIGFIKGHPDHAATERRFRGYREALAGHAIETDGHLVEPGYFDFESGKRATATFLRLEHPPTAIVASNDDMAAGALFEAHEQGLKVPQDIAIVGFDDTPLASHLWPPLTTVRQPISRLAETATNLLIERVAGNALELPVEPFDCEIVVRQSAT